MRAPRSDGLANRQRILEYAEQIFAQEGFSVSLHRIAEDLKMGIGTVYRHFPTRDDLIVGLYERYEQKAEADGERLRALEDPFDRVVVFIDVTIEIAFTSPISRSVASRARQLLHDRPQPGWIAELVSTAVQDAQANGDIRPDITAGDIAVIAGMLADLVHQPEPQRSIALKRMRWILLDAIRPAGSERHDLSGDQITPEDIVSILHNRSTPGQSA